MVNKSRIEQLEKELAFAKSSQVYVRFCCPGTFVSETIDVELTSDIEDIQQTIKEACQEAKNQSARYNAKPYGFYFMDGNYKSLNKGIIYLTGEIKLYDDIPETRETNILKSNMRCNNYPVIIENTNSYRFTTHFNEDDIIVDWNGNIIRQGRDFDLVEYRKKFQDRKNRNEI